MRFPLSTPFRWLAMMLNETGLDCRAYRLSASWCIVILCMIGLMPIINCNNPSCISGDCKSDAIQSLRHERRLSIQQRENDLIQKQKVLQYQLRKLYLEQQQLESESSDAPENPAFDNSELEYEIPSYCANCLGDSFEPSSRSTLSSEFSRKSSESVSSSNQQMPQLSDHNRLEAIKFQILLKLGLKNKPNVTNTLPKQFIFDTLRRSGDPMNNPNDYTMLLQSSDDKDTRDLVLDQLQQLKMSNESSIIDDTNNEDFKETHPEEEQDFDDFYGRTREIITFAEKGESYIAFMSYTKKL